MPTFVSVPLSQEFECPVCCDTMHTVATLMPCLHKLCMADAQRVATCPVCRERVERFAKDHTMTALVADALAAGMVECQGCSAVMGRAASTAHTCTNDLVARLQPLAPHLSQAALRAVIAGWNDVSTTMDDLIDRVLREDQNAVATTAGAAAAAPPTPVAMPRASADGGRLVGTLAFWKPDQRNQFYGFVKLENDDNVFVHSNAVVHGAPRAGVQLSFRVEPSPKDASKRQGCDVVVLQPGEVLGVVVRWPLWDKHKLLYGFVRPYGVSPDDAQSAYFTASTLSESSLRIGSEAIFVLESSSVRPGTQQAVCLRPLQREAPARAALPAAAPPPPPPAAAAPAALPPPLPQPGRTAVHLLWDFDQTYQWPPHRVTATYLNILERLVRDGYAARKADVHGQAFGTMHVLANAAITKALADLQVDVHLVSHLKKEETDKHVERAAQAILAAAAPAVSPNVQSYVVLLSSDKDFTSMVRRLEQNNVRVLLIHDAAPGSAHEAVLSVQPTRTYRLSEFDGGAPPPAALPVPAAAPPPAAAAAAAPVAKAWPADSRTPRLRGTLTRWLVDQRQQNYGFVQIDDGSAAVFVHAKAVIWGTPQVGAVLSVRVEPSLKDASKRQAYDAVVLQSGDHVARVSRWPLRDKRQMLYGFLDVPGSTVGAFFAGTGLTEGALHVGTEVVCSVQDSPGRQGSKQAVNVRPLTNRGAVADH